MKTALIFTSQTELQFNGNANQVLVSGSLPARGVIVGYALSGSMDGTSASDFPTWLRIGLTNQPRIADLTSAVLDAAQNIVSVVKRPNSAITASSYLHFDKAYVFPAGFGIRYGELATIYAVGWGRNGDRVEFDLRLDVDLE